MTRPLDKHIDSQELNALVPSSSDARFALQGLSFGDVRVAKIHVRTCPDCSGKVSKYRQLITFTSSPSVTTLKDKHCPFDEDVDWFEVAAGLWPSLKAAQLIGHAALCDHCGTRLRAAAFLYNDEPTPEEAKLLSELKTPDRPESPPFSWHWPAKQGLIRLMAPAVAILSVVLIVIALQWTARPRFSGQEFAVFAVHAHQQYAIGNVGLEVRSNSQEALNQWLQQKLSFEVALPATPPADGEVRPFQIEGARLIQTANQPSAFIAYQMDTGPATLIVTPETVAVASGGVEAKFKTVSFHYATVEGYKVVTWTQHRRSYALVSEEGNSTQKSCMVCHSAMGDRDLTNTPTPLLKSLAQ